MERKIGEIFEYNGEWYQCVQAKKYECRYCDLHNKCIDANGVKLVTCHARYRSDRKNVVFRKLEKVGEPYKLGEVLIQQYQGLAPVVLPKNSEYSNIFRIISSINVIEIEVKQTKEDMEEKKINLSKEDNALTRTVYAYVNGKISDKELIRSIKEMSDEYPYNKNNLKPFSLELAKAGKPVCTRDGRKARIICFDGKGDQPIIALVEAKGNKDALIEKVERYFSNGHSVFEVRETNNDLMMLPEKKEEWINIYEDMVMYASEEEAKMGIATERNYIATGKVEWEE